MPKTAHTRGWRAQHAPGRVFELKRKTSAGEPVFILCVYPDDGSYYNSHYRQVDRFGCVDRGSRSYTRTNIYGLRPHDLKSSLVARRRTDLERFDARDLELIRYGCSLRFGGRIATGCTRAHLPSLPGLTWTVFWTKSYSYFPSIETRQALDAALHGAWHLESYAGGDWRFGRDSSMHAWATLHTSPRRLRVIEALLRRDHSHIEIQTVTTVTYEGEPGIIHSAPVGHAGPALHGPGRSSHRVGMAGNGTIYGSNAA